MEYPDRRKALLGCAVPVAALQSGADCGVGEFADLAPFGCFCRKAGIGLVQLLPVNDTGGDSSPYSALSAFALHPLYIRLSDVPGTAPFAPEIDAFRTGQKGPRFDYPGIRAFKLSILRRAYDPQWRRIASDRALSVWIRENPWIRAYAAFLALKERHDGRPWNDWGPMRDPSAADVEAFWAADSKECLFHAWVQFHLERQFREAARSLADLGVRLKGDLPILMCEDSADVWADRRFFDLSVGAGAPPDMFSPEGQNWGFPVYRWDVLLSEGCSWWKKRLAQADKFFHAFRIDHVLGFFRIWCVPRTEESGSLGFFSPCPILRTEALRSAGFDEGRTRWLSSPHVSGEDLRAGRRGMGAAGAAARPAAGDLPFDSETAARIAERYLERIGSEDLFLFRPAFDTETAIRKLDEPDAVKGFLLSWHADRALLAHGDGFFPAWYYRDTKAYRSLGEGERDRLDNLLHALRMEAETGWEDRGRTLLSILRDATPMLVCAEDLGDVPDCVPRVLSELGILSLRIERWSRRYKESGSPFIDPRDYPRLSVSTPSVHDTSTLRAWWEENALERKEYWKLLGIPGACPSRLTPEVHEAIVRRNLGSNSLLCVLQLSEILDLDGELRSRDPAADRINVPGTIAETNWTWRMPLSVESLADRKEPAARLASWLGERK
jgi:4-alpha-glucanotransferase